MQKSDVAKEYRKKFPDFPTLKLARIMYKENNLMFKDVEDARARLRYIEGKMGSNKKYKTVKESEFFKEEPRPKNPYNLPESHKEDRTPFRLPLGCNNILLISDLHIPYHDIEAITIALDYGKEHNVNTIFINGDLIDNAQVSKFEKDLKKRSVKEEFDATKQFLVELRKAFPNAEIYWLKGNHCFIEGTEVLTDKGFIDFRDLKETDLVAQFDNNSNITFSHPESIIKKEYDGQVYDIQSGFSRQVVTELHDVIVGDKKIKAKDLSISNLKDIPCTGNINNMDYDINDDMLKLLVNVVCDGCIVLDKKYLDNKMRIQFKLSKERKINNLINVLNNLGIKHSFKLCKKSGVNVLQPYYIRIYGEQAKNIYNLLASKKEFPDFFKKLSSRQAKIVYNELAITDGFLKDNGIFWTTTNKNDVNAIQEMCILNNMYFQYSEKINASGFANSKLQYHIKLREVRSTNTSKSISVKNYSGFVYCVEMPLGSVITRYEGTSGFSGNCIRWEKFLAQKVSEIWDDPYFHLEERLRLNEERIKILDDSILVKAGKLSITHGHHIFKGIFSPVSPARGAYMKAKQSVIVGHLHRTSQNSEIDLDGNVVSCWSQGCLCELRTNYSPLASNAQHGFAHILIQPNGDYNVHNYQIIKGKIH